MNQNTKTPNNGVPLTKSQLEKAVKMLNAKYGKEVKRAKQ